MTAKTAEAAPVVRSAVCVDGISAFTGDGADQREWFIPMRGRGARRPVRVRDHLPADHPLVLANPEAFDVSSEPADAWPTWVLTDEARAARQAATLHTLPCNVRKVTPVCLRCGAESTHSVIVAGRPHDLDLVNALAGLDDSDWHGRTLAEARHNAAKRDYAARAEQLRVAEQVWASEHQACPAGTPRLPDVDVPDNGALPWRDSFIRTR